MKWNCIVAAAAAVALAGPAGAQTRTAGIPPGHAPPPGMCRIWINDVPPGRQPAPTNCVTAERNRPVNARVIYGASSGGDVWRRGLIVTRARDAHGRVIFRDASGRIITRERTANGFLIWRDADENIIRREFFGSRRLDQNDLSKSEKSRLKQLRKSEKARGKPDRGRRGT